MDGMTDGKRAEDARHAAQEGMRDGSGDSVLVAVASNGGGLIDAHFGEADAFSIYAVAATGVKRIGKRVVDTYRTPEGADEDRRDVILRALSDCAACFVARVGEAPRKKLHGAGIEPVSVYADCEIVPSLTAWFAARTTPQGQDGDAA